MYSVASTRETYYILKDKLERREPFVYTRFGDGELDLIEGGVAAGQPYNPNLAADALALLRQTDPGHPGVMNALATHAPESGMEGGLFLGWTNPKYDQYKTGMFDNAIALHYCAVFKPHLLRQLFDLIRARKKVLVTTHRGDPTALIGQHDLVLVPENDAYATIDQWYPHLAEYDLILFAAGAAKCSANLRLLDSGRFVQSIDLGSLLDYALGIPSRTWISMAAEKYPEARTVLLGG